MREIGEEKKKEEKERGCLHLFFVPLVVSIVSVAFMILVGITINFIVHFESSQVKIIWIGISFFLGIVIYYIVSKLKASRGDEK